MTVFTYEARDRRGEMTRGTINADDIALAGRALRAEGKYVIDLRAGVDNAGDPELEEIRASQAAGQVTRRQVIDLCHQLSLMLDTGVALKPALDTYLENTRDAGIRRVVRSIADEVENGSSLSSSLSRWPRVFPPLMIALIQAAEVSGTLALMLQRIAKYLGKEHKTARQIKGALTYPCVMMLFALCITAFLLTFVLPRFARIYASRSAALPAPTKIMMALSDFATHHWLVILITVGALVAAFLATRHTAPARRCRDWLKLNTPVIRVMFSKLFLTRSARTLSTLLAAGVELTEAIRVTRNISGNCYHQAMWERVLHDLEQGKRLSEACRDSRIFPTNVIQMISAGEQSGRLGPVFERVGDVAEEELDEAVAQTTQYIEPIMIVSMGAIIGFVAISLLMPIMTIARVVK